MAGAFDRRAVLLYDANGVAHAVYNGVAIPAETPALLVAGSDPGAVARYLRMAADGTVRVDPTGTTAQPVTDNAGSLTVDTPQLPAALVGGRLDENVGAWLGSTAPTVGQKAMAASVPVVLPSDQTVATQDVRSSTSALSNVAASVASVTLLAANAARLGATVYNDSASVLYVKLGAAASSSSFTVRLITQDYYEVPFGYTGIIDGVWVAAVGAARVTELT